MRIGEILIKNDLINQSQLEKIHAIQERTGSKFGQILIKEGLITNDQLIFTLVQQHLGREKVKRNVFKFKQISLFLRYLISHRSSAISLSALFLLTGILLITYSKIIGYYLSNIAISGSLTTIGSYITVILCLLVFHRVLGFFRDLMNHKFSLQFSYSTRNDLYQHLMLIPLRSFRKFSTGDLLNRLFDNVYNSELFSLNFFQGLIGSSLILIIYFFILVLINPTLTIAILVLSLMIILIPAQLGKHAGKFTDLQAKKAGALFSFFEETFSNIETIKSLGKTNYITGKFHRLIFDYFRTNLRLNIVWASSYAVNTLMFSYSRICIVILGAYFAMHGTISLSNYIFFLFSYSSFYEIIQNLYTFFISQMPWGASNMTRIDSLLTIRAESDTGAHIIDFNHSISLKNVDFAYADRPILTDFSLDFEKGKCYAIVGESGCGKSTVLSLLTGLYQPVKGDILIDNNNISALNIESYRKLIGYVGQFPYLYHLSIRENIWLGNVDTDIDASIDAIEHAARTANIHKDISRFERGYDTMLSGALELSEGQKQRISIARSFYGNNRILLFDEPTRSVEQESKKIIFKAIENYRKHQDATICMVTHEFVSMDMFDEIIVMEQGVIVDKGSHAALARRSKTYRQLLKTN